MTARTRFLITAAFVCHLLLAPSLVTSQLLSPARQPVEPAPVPVRPSTLREEDVTIPALEQEKQGPLFKLGGHAEIRLRQLLGLFNIGSAATKGNTRMALVVNQPWPALGYLALATSGACAVLE
jgi:hypothetical protein